MLFYALPARGDVEHHAGAQCAVSGELFEPCCSIVLSGMVTSSHELFESSPYLIIVA